LVRNHRWGGDSKKKKYLKKEAWRGGKSNRGSKTVGSSKRLRKGKGGTERGSNYPQKKVILGMHQNFENFEARSLKKGERAVQEAGETEMGRPKGGGSR